jgi:hypothetical protein
VERKVAGIRIEDVHYLCYIEEERPKKTIAQKERHYGNTATDSD